MIEAPVLVTPRLRLRMLPAEDFEAYVAIHSDFEVTRFTTRSPLTREDAWKHMATIVGHWHLRGYGMWGVEEIASEKQLIESVFAGGGDMGARMRAFDWSTTDLGPVAQWPQSLRAGVRIVLAAGHPMLISWGPDYTMLYNDAYGVVVGTKHPGALGRSCREVLAEAWDFIGPRFDA